MGISDGVICGGKIRFMNDENPKWVPLGSIIESTVIALAASFPITGSIASGWTEYKNYKQTQHIEDILVWFAKKLEELKENVDEKYLTTEEAKRLVERTSILGKDEIREEKRKMLSEFLANSSTKSLSTDTEKDMVLDTIEKISPSQSRLLCSITELLVIQWGRENIKIWSDYDPDDKQKPTLGYILESWLVRIYLKNSTKENTEASLDYMVSIGVIELQSARWWVKVWGKTGIKWYRPTKLGIKVLEYLGIRVNEMTENKE